MFTNKFFMISLILSSLFSLLYTNGFSQQLTEVSFVSGFQTSVNRGEINLNTIPDFNLPSDIKIIWGMPAENRLRANNGNDVNQMFKRGFSHLDFTYMKNGFHYYQNTSSIPNGWTAPIKYKNRSHIASYQDAIQSDYLYDSPDGNEWSTIMRYFHPSSYFNESWVNTFSLVIEDFEETTAPYTLDNRNRITAYMWSRKNYLPSPANENPPIIGTYACTPIVYPDFSPGAANNPFVSTIGILNPKYTETIQQNSNTIAYNCPTALYGQSLSSISDFYSFEIYPSDNMFAPNNTYVTNEITGQGAGNVYNFVVNHEDTYWRDNAYFHAFAQNEMYLEHFNDKPIIPTITFWNKSWSSNLGVAQYFFPSTNNYTSNPYAMRHENAVNESWVNSITFFSFLSGIKGQYAWGYFDNNLSYSDIMPWTGNSNSQDYVWDANHIDYTPVEHYSHALYRLFGLNGDLFDNTTVYLNNETEISYDGGLTYVQWNAGQIFANHKPYVRAMVHGDDILVAAVMPYANQNFTQDLKVRYNGWVGDFTITGDKTYLYRANMSDGGLTVHENESVLNTINVYPNPTKETLILGFSSNENQTFQASLIDFSGRIVLYKKVTSNMNNELDVTSLNRGIYVLKVEDSNGNTVNKKIILD